MDTYFLFIFLAFFIFLLALAVVVLWSIAKLRRGREQCERDLSETKKEQEEVYDTIASLTSFSGVQSTLEYIAEQLQKLGFSKILILLIDKKKQALGVKVARGFNEDVVRRQITLPITSHGGTLTQALFYNKFFVVEDKGSELYTHLEHNDILDVGSFMAAPLARKSDDRCWELFACAQTTCPAYENENLRCWTIPDTKCTRHLKGDYDEVLFSDPDKKLEACLHCEQFQTLGVMLVAHEDFRRFSYDEKKIFRTFTYQAGAKLERAYLLGHLEGRERELTRRMYEVSILKELGERIGYSLNIQRIADIITGSLKKIIDYSAASYMLFDPARKKLLFRCQLEETVNRNFVDTVKQRMLASFTALVNQDLEERDIDESLAGVVLDETVTSPVRSFFNIPLVVGEKVVGVLNVASTRSGLYKEAEVNILYKITTQASRAVTHLQEVLDTEQGKLNAMVSSMADGVLMIDKEHRIYVINPKVRTMLGLEKGDISIFDIIDTLSDTIDFRAKFEESVRLNRLIIVDEVCINERFLRILFSPVKDTEGITLGSVIIFHDITHDKEIEKMREDFTHMMVHDLRSPLNGIRLMTELLQKRKIPQDEFMEAIALVHQNAAQMLEFVNDLLDLAKIEAGKFQIEKQLASLQQVFNDQVTLFRPFAQEKMITLTTQIDRTLPLVKFDRKAIGQVLSNLLSNALKFTGVRGIVIIQAIQYKEDEPLEKQALKHGIKWFLTNKTKDITTFDDDTIICAVTDSGCGIPEEQIPKLFTKFRQLKTGERIKTKGTGLGLVIAKGIVEAHEGIIGVESRMGEGSSFFFTLPVK